MFIGDQQLRKKMETERFENVFRALSSSTDWGLYNPVELMLFLTHFEHTIPIAPSDELQAQIVSLQARITAMEYLMGNGSEYMGHCANLANSEAICAFFELRSMKEIEARITSTHLGQAVARALHLTGVPLHNILFRFPTMLQWSKMNLQEQQERIGKALGILRLQEEDKRGDDFNYDAASYATESGRDPVDERPTKRAKSEETAGEEATATAAKEQVTMDEVVP